MITNIPATVDMLRGSRFRLLAVRESIEASRFGVTLRQVRRDVEESTGDRVSLRTIRRDLQLLESLGVARKAATRWQLMAAAPVPDVQRVGAGESISRLSPRQRAILKRVAEGLSSAEIANQLGIAATSVDTHRSRIRKRLGLTTPDALMRFALLAFGS